MNDRGGDGDLLVDDEKKAETAFAVCRRFWRGIRALSTK